MSFNEMNTIENALGHLVGRPVTALSGMFYDKTFLYLNQFNKIHGGT